MYKCELFIDGYVYNVTDDLVNWDEVKLAFKRENYDGVIRSFSTKFEFAGTSYALLKGKYREKYLQASVSIVFYTRNNSWTWNERFRCALDYSTYSDDGSIISINAIDNSLASLIKANKGTQYEYPVGELKEGEALYYDRLMMTSTAKWIITGDNVEENNITYIRNTFEDVNGDSVVYGSNYTYPLYLNGNPEIAVKNIVEIFDVEKNYYAPSSSNFSPLLKNISESGIRININIKFKLHVSFSDIKNEVYGATLHLNAPFGSSTGILKEVPLVSGENDIDINLPNTLIYGKSLNGRLVCYIHVSRCTCIVNQVIPSASNELLIIDFTSKDLPLSIDIIKPLSLLNRLLKSINGEKEGVTCEIASGVDSRLDNTLIVAAESIRGLDNAKIYTSYSKFADWMKSEFGFVPVVGENKVTFVHRDSLFQDIQIKDIADNWSEFEYSVNSSLIYSSVKVGYDKQDYDSVNGRDEFRFTNEYTTGITLTNNVLDLISPYRADAYGIEFLAAKRGEDTTDSDSDSDIFFVGASVSEGEYKLIRGGDYSIAGVVSPESMFNVMYAPRFMLEANRKYIGAGVSRLRFASSEGNSGVIINGTSLTDDIVISESNFTVGEVSIETCDTNIPQDLKGYISFVHQGERYKGYIKNADFNYGKDEAIRYTLTIKSIE